MAAVAAAAAATAAVAAAALAACGDGCAIGTADEAEDLGTFSGSTIADSSTIKAALQALETAVEAAGVVDAGDNVNRLVASTTAQTAPSTYYFLVVDQSDGSIKVIDKSFLEIDD